MRIIQKKRAQQYFRRRVVVPTPQQGNTVIELFLISVSSCFNTCIRIGKFLSCIVGIRWVGESSSLPHTVFFWWNSTTAKSLRTTDNYCFLCWVCRFPCRPWEVLVRAPRSSLSSKPTFYVLCSLDWIYSPFPLPQNREFKNATFLSHLRKPPGNELLSSLTCFHTTTLKLLSTFWLAEMINLEFLARPLSWHAKRSLPVSVRSSKTSIAKAL